MGRPAEGMPTPWRDEDTLQTLFNHQDLSAPQIADRLGCAPGTVYKWLREHDIYDATPQEKQPPYHGWDLRGYEHWRVHVDGTQHVVLVHRLLAVAEFGVEAVKNNVVHHKNGVKWDNRPCNIKPKSRDDHNKGHLYDQYDHNPQEWDEKPPWEDRNLLQELYTDHRMTTHEIAEELGCSATTIRSYMDKKGIERRPPGPQKRETE